MDSGIRHTWISKFMVDLHVIQTAHASANLFPLYLYPDPTESSLKMEAHIWNPAKDGRVPNFDKSW
ncbi:MAG: hypothetical protein R2883_05020 [Caldisericia bacterium]